MLVVVLLGPTASGKTELAIRLAQAFSTEIVSFDSIQVYKEIAIGAAKPTVSQLNTVKHHLIGEVGLDRVFTAGDFRRAALDILDHWQKKVAVMVGGTGFYLQALLQGMFELPSSTEEIKNELLDSPTSVLWEELRVEDPEYAEQINSADSYRIRRALEVIRLTGQKMSDAQKQFRPEPFPYQVLQFGLLVPRSVLKARIDNRVRKMIEAGLIEETKQLKEKYPNAKVLGSVGYKETVQFLNQQIKTIEDLHAAIVMSTMKLAKRQMTWFKRDKTVEWVDSSKVDVHHLISKIRLALDKER